VSAIEPSRRAPATVVAARVLAALQLIGLVAIVLLGAVVALPAAVLLALAVLPLRRGRRGPWMALIIVEALLGFGGVLAAAFALVYALLPLLSCIAVIVLMTSPSASAWSDPRLVEARTA
jgi:hypothetical protein